MNNNAKLDIEKIPAFVKTFKGNMEFRAAAYPVFIYKYIKDPILEIAERKLLEDTENIIEKLQSLAKED